MRVLLLLLLALLPACGFSPVYATAARPNLANVAVANIPERAGQQLRLALTDRLYGAASPITPSRYLLEVNLTRSTENLSIQRNDVATRARLTLLAAYILRDRTTGEVVTEGRERSFVSYNILSGPYATITAEQSATERGIQEVANMITNRLALALSDK
jgi:LPS-assembly lipoprotein